MLNKAQINQTKYSKKVRGFIFFIIIALFIPIGSHTADAKKKDRAVEFMKRVSKELMTAVKTGSKRQLARVIRKYADLKGIGLYSLGDYRRKMPRRKLSTYYQGMTKFMARYFIDQSKKYPIASAKVESPSFRENGETIVDTIVRLKDGTDYEVQWRLTRYKRSYRVRDIRILGFWLTPYQRDLFNNFVTEQGGNINALVIALNHN